MKRKSRRKGFDPLRVFSGPMFEQRMTSAELALIPHLKRDAAGLEAAVGAAPRPGDVIVKSIEVGVSDQPLFVGLGEGTA